MSEGYVAGNIDLTVRIGELLVSISGPSEAAQQLLREITSGRSGSSAPGESQQHHGFSAGISSTSRATFSETRDQIESSFPLVPADVKDLARHLSGSPSSTSARVSRAIGSLRQTERNLSISSPGATLYSAQRDWRLQLASPRQSPTSWQWDPSRGSLAYQCHTLSLRRQRPGFIAGRRVCRSLTSRTNGGRDGAGGSLRAGACPSFSTSGALRAHLGFGVGARISAGGSVLGGDVERRWSSRGFAFGSHFRSSTWRGFTSSGGGSAYRQFYSYNDVRDTSRRGSLGPRGARGHLLGGGFRCIYNWIPSRVESRRTGALWLHSRGREHFSSATGSGRKGAGLDGRSLRTLFSRRVHCSERGCEPCTSQKACKSKSSLWARRGYTFRKSSKTKEADDFKLGSVLRCGDGDSSKVGFTNAANSRSARSSGAEGGLAFFAPCYVSPTFVCVSGGSKGTFGGSGRKVVESSSKDLPWYIKGKGYGCSTSPFKFGSGSCSGVGEGGFGRRVSVGGPSTFGAEQCPSGFGGSDGWSSRSLSRPHIVLIDIYKRVGWQGKASSRTCCKQGSLLRCSYEVNGKADVTYDGQCIYGSSISDDGRSLRHKVSGEVWRLRKAERLGPTSVSDYDCYGLPADGECPGCQRHYCFDCCDDRAGGAGWWEVRDSPVADPSRRHSSISLYEQTAVECLQSEGLCPLSGSALGHGGFGISQGTRCNQHKESGVDAVRFGFFSSKSRWGRRSKECKATKEKVQGQRQRIFSDESGGGGLNPRGHLPTDDALNLLGAKTNFVKWALALPRLVLSARSDFGWWLARSFSVSWRGSSSQTAAFPLPVPYPGVFSGGGPHLSRRRLQTLAQKRLVHLMVFALNQLYLGHPPSLSDLRRPPNKLQCAIYERLYRYVAVCGSRPEDLPVPPGRSGSELIACIAALERFLETSEDLRGSYFEGGRRDFVAPGVDEAGVFPQLRPFRSLEPDRLKITGRGLWPLEEYLDSPLWLPYVEPRFLLHGQKVDESFWPALSLEKPGRYLDLAKRWDHLGLLRLYSEPICEGHFTRVFNAYKDQLCDRQIGDRRIPNSREREVEGPSAWLPPGFLLTSLQTMKWKESLRCSMTDRRDFYHQAMVSSSRARSNMVPFSFPADEFSGSAALRIWKEELEKASSLDRLQVGDGFGKLTPELWDGGRLFPCFAALFQGDHLGVEFALEAHQGLLTEWGLLSASTRLQNKKTLPFGRVWESLIIDDYFCISTQDRHHPPEETAAFEKLEVARRAYEKSQLPGSVEKDIVAADLFKAAGAEVDSRKEAIELGVVPVAAPLSKRCGLATLSLRLASLPALTTSLASKLAGSWVSVLMFRRCLSSVVDELFALGVQGEDQHPQIFPLPRRTAGELVLLSILTPLAFSDASADFLGKAYATDASLKKGAIVSAEVGRELSRALWLSGDKKGNYTRLDNPFRSARRHLGQDLDQEWFEEHEWVDKPIALCFDFVEIFGGVGRVSEAMASLGYTVAPVLDLTSSKAYDLGTLDMLRWVIHMVESGRFRSLLLAPPCTTFSPAAHPACRSYKVPKGWFRRRPKVFFGNLMAFRSMIIMRCAVRCKVPAGTEQPRRSKMRWLPEWKSMMNMGCEEAVVASCMFGSPHQKEFCFLLHLVKVEDLDTRCSRDHTHIKIQGSYTKPSAMYTVPLAEHIASGFAAALERQSHVEDGQNAPVYEGILTNDVLIAQQWVHEDSWDWRGQRHINIREIGSVLRLLRRNLGAHPESRFPVLIDSRVAKGALAKGRSSSRALQPGLKRGAAYQLAGGLFPSYGFAPTRLNPSDDPTRDKDIREPSRFSLTSMLSLESLYEAQIVPLSKGQAGWSRLVLLMVLLEGAEGAVTVNDEFFPYGEFSVPWLCLCLGIFIGLLTALIGCGASWISDGFRGAWIFDGFRSAVDTPVVVPPKTQKIYPGVLWPLLLVSLASCAMAPIAPETLLETARAQSRQSVHLVADRAVRPKTRENRVLLLDQLGKWVSENSLGSWGEIVAERPPDAERIGKILVAYGKSLYYGGKSYNKFSETINAVAAYRPILRRQLGEAWDLAFAWLQDEPGGHHPALPSSILLAALSVCLMWGWEREAAAFATMWSGILRVGEMISALRSDLVLPRDTAPGQRCALLRIREPKTRGRGAKHQSARIDPEDLVLLLDMVYQGLDSNAALWPLSSSTLRKRFESVMKQLLIPTQKSRDFRPYELASFRAGGATWLLGATESPDLVRRRGRWLSPKSMEIYLQEITVATSWPKLSTEARVRIQLFSGCFAQVLHTASFLKEAHVPAPLWQAVFAQSTSGDTGDDGSMTAHLEAAKHTEIP